MNDTTIFLIVLTCLLLFGIGATTMLDRKHRDGYESFYAYLVLILFGFPVLIVVGLYVLSRGLAGLFAHWGKQIDDKDMG